MFAKNGNVDVSVVINLPRDPVAKFVSDPRNDLYWWKGMKEVAITSGNGEVGTIYTQHASFLGLNIKNVISITESNIPESVTMEEKDSALPFVAHYTFDRLDLNGKEAVRYRMQDVIDMKNIPALFRPLFLSMTRIASQGNFNNLKKVLESNPELLKNYGL